MAAFKVKADYKGEFRRLTLPENTDFATLRAALAGIYGPPEGGDAYTMGYFDDESDFVTIGSDAELREAIDVTSANTTTPLRLTLGVAGVPMDKPPAPTPKPAPTPTA
eukprot:CAMPEP_0198311146 /NCGR_PEP_ID=MMETSP1450-20131203/2960_1 /TAXON_ID=753684 ORGANISM="Madagascaria erythrocladiodes, Strain CCMP3234" /NCGR_SAMPLE_ID=MMETSP1450 /ASSEMBLY_ACC=CAM_ASM_001115 /LENGTH=107 /DNA_ID=CAMNT_0044014007 /DNA_START=135 /DNA_END=455 /DNA_ORIENTATION=-